MQYLTEGIMSDINSVVLTGRLTADPEGAQTQSGTYYSRFTLASGAKYKDKETTTFIRCTAWSGLAEKYIQPYFKKGALCTISGRLVQNSWQDKDGNKRSEIQIVVDGAKLMSGGMGDSKPSAEAPAETNFTDTDIPF